MGFLVDITGYVFEAVVVEALNVSGVADVPLAVRPGGNQVTLGIRTEVPNKLYIQFPGTLATTWAVKAQPNCPVHGYFELRVTEPVGGAFRKTWKPLRGVVQILFSPTNQVADV